MSGLKPCPFCGGEAHVVEGMYSSYQEGYAVRCRHCALTLGASGRLGECYEWSCCYGTEAEAIDAWNTRAYYEAELDALPMTEENMREYGWVRERTCRMEWDEDSEGEELYPVGHVSCSACGAWLYSVNTMRFCPTCGAAVVE